MLQDQQSTQFSQQLVYFLFIILIILWSRRRKFQFEQRMIKQRSFSIPNIDDQKIILAIQIKNLICETADKKMNGYQALEIQLNNVSWVQKIKKMFGYGGYYKLMFQKNKIKSFFKTLKSFQKIQIYLYTSLNKSFAQSLLKKIGIQEYFPQAYRRYIGQEQIKVNQKKHPTQIDHNTKRVIIMTPNKQDFDQEDKKYFLVLNRLNKDKLLKGAIKLIKQILLKVQSVDQLHSQMDQIKAQIQTDHQIDMEVYQ